MIDNIDNSEEKKVPKSRRKKFHVQTKIDNLKLTSFSKNGFLDETKIIT